jgi:hypothetical protein
VGVRAGQRARALAGASRTRSATTPPFRGRPSRARACRFVLVDDFGYAEVGYHRDNDTEAHREIVTPTIDSLVANGVELDRHYVHMMCTCVRTCVHVGPRAVLPSSASGHVHGIASIAGMIVVAFELISRRTGPRPAFFVSAPTRSSVSVRAGVRRFRICSVVAAAAIKIHQAAMSSL